MTLIPLKNLLSSHIKRTGIGRQVNAAQAVEKCNEILSEIFGTGILKRARAMYLRNKVLTIGCISTVLTQEIYLKRNKIIKELNNCLGQGVVENLKFKM